MNLRAEKDWIDMTGVLNEEGYKKTKRGDILVFAPDGVKVRYKVMRKRFNKLMVKKVTLYDQTAMEHEGHKLNLDVTPVHCDTCDVDLT